MEVIVYATENHYDKLYEMLNKIKMYKREYGNKSNNRLDFPSHYGAIFGISKHRYYKIESLSYYSKKYPEIYEEMKRIGDLIVPFPWKSIQVNRNLVCTKHRDKKNTSQSILVSFGEYTGGEIVIEGIQYNAYHTPIQFDGTKLEHWNNPIQGNKYSLVFFC